MNCDRTVESSLDRGAPAGLNAATCAKVSLSLTGTCVGTEKRVCTMCTPLPSDPYVSGWNGTNGS